MKLTHPRRKKEWDGLMERHPFQIIPEGLFWQTRYENLSILEASFELVLET